MLNKKTQDQLSKRNFISQPSSWLKKSGTSIISNQLQGLAFQFVQNKENKSRG